MLFGIHSLLFNETFEEKDLPLLDRCKKLGFDAVELIPFDPDNFPAKQVNLCVVFAHLAWSTSVIISMARRSAQKARLRASLGNSAAFRQHHGVRDAFEGRMLSISDQSNLLLTAH